jgi:hypothetical protein
MADGFGVVRTNRGEPRRQQFIHSTRETANLGVGVWGTSLLPDIPPSSNIPSKHNSRLNVVGQLASSCFGRFLTRQIQLRLTEI